MEITRFMNFVFYRLSSILFIQTTYVPDEYWQSVEVAHNMVFGYGYLTWEWKYGLRSYLYPFLISIFYEILKVLHLDYSCVLIFLPKVLQACLTALSDEYFFHLCKLFDYEDHWVTLAIFTNWFWYYCGFRTLTNTFETALNTIGFYYYPWNLFIKEKPKILFFDLVKTKSIRYLSFAVFSCLIRPTSATIWVPLILFQMYTFTQRYNKSFITQCLFPIAFCFVLVSFLIDFLFYGEFIIPAYNFFMFNVLQDISSFYGTHSFIWYLTQGLPVVLGLNFLPFIIGCYMFSTNIINKFRCLYRKVQGILLFVVGLNLVILSNIPHKEFRFLLPIMPLMMLIVVSTLTEVIPPSKKKLRILWTTLSIFGFLVPSLLFGVFHQRGTLSLMAYLRDSVEECKPNCFFLFLMPCHSTPLYSHLHSNVTVRFLTCNPPLDKKDNFDESEEFFKNPGPWLTKFWEKKTYPTHIAFFNSIEPNITVMLNAKGFKKKTWFFHTFYPQKRTGTYVVLYTMGERSVQNEVS